MASDGEAGGPGSARPPARSRPATGSHVARRRVRGWTAGVVAVSMLAGGLFALSAQTAAGLPLRTDRGDQASLVRSGLARNDELRAKLDRLRSDNAAKTESFGGIDSQVAALQSASGVLAPAAGLASVRGPAVQVTLDDAPRGAPVPPSITPDDLVVHQQDVQAVVNALWAGGAEAMMLMDQRVISTSAVRCVGNTLILQGRVYSPPYTIRAIGDAGRLRAALAISPEIDIYLEFVALVGLRYSVDDLGERVFPAFTGSTMLKYARPLTPGETSQDTDPAQPLAAGRVSAGTVSPGTVSAGAE